MKIYGVFFTYNQMNFLPYIIRMSNYALDVGALDKVIIMEGAHSTNYPLRSPDGSGEYLEKAIGNDKRYVLLKSDAFRGKYHFKDVQAVILNHMISHIPIDDNTWMFYYHDDEFFFNQFFKDMKSICSSAQDKGYDMVMTKQMAFAYNFQLYWKKRTAYMLCKLYKDTKWVPLTSVAYGSGLRYFDKKNYAKVKYDEDDLHITFHFSHVKKPNRQTMRINNGIEIGGGVDRITRWYNEIFLKADLDNLEETYKKNEKIWGGYGFYKDACGFGPETFQKLSTYEGLYPEILKDHPYQKIKDVRLVDE